MNTMLRFGLILLLLAAGCRKPALLVDPLGVWQCAGYETIRYVSEDSTKVWSGNAWEWKRSYRVNDSTHTMTDLQITITDGGDNQLMVTNLITKADSTIGGPATWDHIDNISLNYYLTDSLNNQKVYRLWLPGLKGLPGVTVLLYFDYQENIIHLSYDAYIKGSFGTNLGNTTYLGGKKSGN